MNINAAIRVVFWLILILSSMLTVSGLLLYLKESGQLAQWRAGIVGDQQPLPSYEPLAPDDFPGITGTGFIDIPLPSAEDEQPASQGFNLILLGWVTIGIGVLASLGALAAHFLRASAQA